MVGKKRKALELDEESSDASSSNTDREFQQQDTSNDSGSRRSSSPPEELSRTSIRDQLRYCLANVKYVGSFTASQARQRNVDPGLHVKGVGNISLPLTPADAKAIMKAGTQAPFGRGSKTVVDTNFRNTKELDASHFTLRNPAWEQELQDIVAHLGQVLGFQESTSDIKPELYKLLLYEKGAMFKAHKDSEKSDGMFGTLVICLPSKHSGGSIVLSHHGETTAFETATASEFGQSHIAWYSDVVHEIKPVTSGYRLVLTYNLIRTGYAGPMSARTLVDEKAKFQRILKEWKQRFNVGQPTLNKLAWVLDHEYSEANLSLQRLKGHDDLLGRYMAEICKMEGFTIMFAKITLTVFDTARKLDSDNELEQMLNLSHVFNVYGHLMVYDGSINHEEMIQQDCFDRHPDKVEAEETGNEGVDETHFYHNAVMLLCPYTYAIEFNLAHLNSEDVITWIQKLIGNLNDANKDILVQICRREAKAYYMKRHERLIACVIEACTALKDAQLLVEAVRGCSASRPGSVVHRSVAQALRVFPFVDVEPSLDELTRYDTKIHLNSIAITNIRSYYEELRVGNETLSEMPKLKRWEKARIKDVMLRADKLVPEDAPQLVDIVKFHGKDMAKKHVLPLLKKHKSCTEAVISCLADIFEEGHTSKIPQDTADFIFDKAVHTTTSALSIQASYPKKAQESPSTHADFNSQRSYFTSSWWDQKDIAKRVASFYCQCLYTHHDNEATCVLTWLEDEAETADIRIFHEVIFPFLENLPERMQSYNITVSETQQKASQHMVLAFLNRCVGKEPAKPTTWTRSTRGCGEAACSLCPKLDEFLKDPKKEIAYLEDVRDQWSRWSKGHLYDLCGPWSRAKHECTPDHQMEDGRKLLRIKKTDSEWAETHKAWEGRCDRVAGALKHGLVESRPLLGERYDELVEMRPIKILK